MGIGLEPEQMIEIVDSTNNLIGYVSGTLPNAVTNHDNTVTIDANDESESDSNIDTIRPEAPPEIPADKDIVTIDHTHANHDSDLDGDSDTLSIGQDAPPNILSDNDNDNTLSSQESTCDETETYEIIDELLNEDNEPTTPAIPIVSYPGNIENADDYANHGFQLWSMHF